MFLFAGVRSFSPGSHQVTGTQAVGPSPVASQNKISRRLYQKQVGQDVNRYTTVQDVETPRACQNTHSPITPPWRRGRQATVSLRLSERAKLELKPRPSY